MEYKVGDKVRVVCADDKHSFNKGDTLVVIYAGKHRMKGAYVCVRNADDEFVQWVMDLHIELVERNRVSIFKRLKSFFRKKV